MSRIAATPSIEVFEKDVTLKVSWTVGVVRLGTLTITAPSTARSIQKSPAEANYIHEQAELQYSLGRRPPSSMLLDPSPNIRTTVLMRLLYPTAAPGYAKLRTYA